MEKDPLTLPVRVAFTMKLKEGYREEYIRRHNEIWPALTALLSASGVRDYSIFLDENTDTLFAVQQVVGGSGSQDLGQNAIVKEWWRHMSDIMETNPDNSPITHPLKEVFYLP